MCRRYAVVFTYQAPKAKVVIPVKTKVSQQYTPSLNLSVTTRNGVVTKVTTWVSGVDKSTEVLVDHTPASVRWPRKR